MAANSHSHRKKRKSSLGKGLQNRISMGGISYLKDLEFPADGPGRVIVRLERLMGSDRIRITDAKYMTTLLQRLQEEEEVTWQKRTRERRKAEHNRFRQLVIDGHTEPTQAMQDLYNHPVFRVNRILNRLAKLSTSITPATHLPPIVPTEPFEYDESGRVFKLYPGHFSMSSLIQQTEQKYNHLLRQSRKTLLTPLTQAKLLGQSDSASYLFHKNAHLQDGSEIELFEKGKHESEQGYDEHETESDGEKSVKGEFYLKISDRGGTKRNNPLLESKIRKSQTTSSKLSTLPTVSRGPSRENWEKPSGHIIFAAEGGQSGMQQKSGKKSIFTRDVFDEQGRQVLTLQQIQKKYGIAPNTDLGVQWKPYQAPVLDALFHQQRGLSKIYKLGAKIVGMYNRQQLTANDYIASLKRTSESIPRERARVTIDDNEEYEDNEEEEKEQKILQIDEDVDNVPQLTNFDDLYKETDGEGEDDDTTRFFEPTTPQRNSEAEEASGELTPPTWDDLESAYDEQPSDEAEMEEEFEENE